ncbi:MAG: hypothetical protein ACK56W_02145 [Pirellula sp.]|nr:hypothetical protein [Pirellula sp.]
MIERRFVGLQPAFLFESIFQRRNHFGQVQAKDTAKAFQVFFRDTLHEPFLQMAD